MTRQSILKLALVTTLAFTAHAALGAPDTWDSRLTTLWVYYTEANVPAGTWYWRLTIGQYQNENESGGNHNIYYKALDANGNPTYETVFTATYDEYGRRTSLANAKNETTRWTFNPSYGPLTKVTQTLPNGMEASDEYDPAWGEQIARGSADRVERPPHLAHRPRDALDRELRRGLDVGRKDPALGVYRHLQQLAREHDVRDPCAQRAVPFRQLGPPPLLLQILRNDQGHHLRGLAARHIKIRLAPPEVGTGSEPFRLGPCVFKGGYCDAQPIGCLGDGFGLRRRRAELQGPDLICACASDQRHESHPERERNCACSHVSLLVALWFMAERLSSNVGKEFTAGRSGPADSAANSGRCERNRTASPSHNW